MSNNQCVTADLEGADDEHLALVARCLKDYLAIHGKPTKTYEVLQYLAENTLARLADGKDARFNYFAIRLGVTGEAEGDASAWFSRYWKSLMGDFRQACEEGVQRLAANQGLKVYPWIAKQESDGGAGKQAFISIVVLPIPENVLGIADGVVPPASDISYIPVEKLKLSWWARWLFDENQVAQGWRKTLLIWPSILWFVVVGIGVVILLSALSIGKAPVTSSDLVGFIVIGGFAWYTRHRINRFIRLVDDRILMANDSMVGFREFGVCMELFKPEGAIADAPKRVRMIKYAAQCPVCSAQVLLDEGEPDFPRRIVGRCLEGPREHVFSFDRVTRTGYRLR